jgi:hypothetical protein
MRGNEDGSFLTCAAKNKSIDPIFSKHKADVTGYVGAERGSRLLFGACSIPFSIGLLRATTNANHVTGLALQANAEKTLWNRSQLSLFKFVPSFTNPLPLQ